MLLGPIHTKKIRRIKTELTNKSSQKDDLNQNRPITLLNLFYFFQSEWGHIQSLNALIAQLLTAQKQQQQQSLIVTLARESTKCDVAVQSEPPAPCTSDDVGESASMVKNDRNSPPSPSPKIEQLQHYQQ